MAETKHLPVGATTPERLVELRQLTDDEKRRKRLYWAYLGHIASETILYTGALDKEYPLDLGWGGTFFENFWHAWAHALQTRPKP